MMRDERRTARVRAMTDRAIAGAAPMDGLVPPGTAAALRAGADPVVWSHVARAMRENEVRDAIAFRVHPVGTGWRIAAQLLVAAAVLRRLTASGRAVRPGGQSMVK